MSVYVARKLHILCQPVQGYGFIASHVTRTWAERMKQGLEAYTSSMVAHAWPLQAGLKTRSRSAGLEDVEASDAQLRDLHKLIAKVTADTQELRFNTAIAAMMEFMNATKKWPSRPRAALEPFALLLAPYAPHLAEECWAMCGKAETLTYEEWPIADEALLVESVISLPIQARVSCLLAHLQAQAGPCVAA